MAEDLLAFVMAGGVGGRLRPLTDVRAKPAVPFGGIYRIIDFPLSNCINSDIRRVYVLTQYKSQSLGRHLKSGWNFLSRRLDQFIDEIPAQMQMGQHWYEGTADAIRQNVSLVDRVNPRHVLILPGDHIYKMEFRHMRRFHEERGAHVTIAATRVDAAAARGRYGVIQIDPTGRVVEFQEKPAEPKCLPGTNECLASMGIYLWDTNRLPEALDNAMADFSRQILPAMVASGAPVYAYDFATHNRIQEYEYITRDGHRIRNLVDKSSDADYWRDVGTIEAFWGANLDLVAPHPRFNLYGERWPIFSSPGHFPPAKFVHEVPGRTGQAHNSIIADGVILSGCLVRNSLLSAGLYVHSYALIENSILFGGALIGSEITETTIGRGSRIRNAIIDKNVQLRAGTVIGYDRTEDARRGLSVHPITGSDDYIVVVPKGFEL